VPMKTVILSIKSKCQKPTVKNFVMGAIARTVHHTHATCLLPCCLLLSLAFCFFALLLESSFVYLAAKNKMASVQKETSSAITLKGSTEIVADFFGSSIHILNYSG